MATNRTENDIELLRRFGAHLKDVRVAKKLTQEELADAAGFTRSYYTEIETGKRNTALLNLHKLAVCLGISLSDLLTGEWEGGNTK